MAQSKKETLLRYALNALTLTFYVFLTALVLYICFAAILPAMTYWQWLLPAFGVIYAHAAGTDIALMKINLDKYFREK